MRKIFCRSVVALFAALTLLVSSVQAGEKCFLWKIQSKTATVYILGSMHMAKPDIYPLPQKIEESFAKSAVLALEADPAKAQDTALLRQMLAAAAYAKGGTLKEHLSGETFELARREIERLGLP
ncbi:MAG: TraB/GumN family protein, partial [Geobacteraceae bacterium]